MEQSRQTKGLKSTSKTCVCVKLARFVSGIVIGNVMRNDRILLLVESGRATIFQQRRKCRYENHVPIIAVTPAQAGSDSLPDLVRTVNGKLNSQTPPIESAGGNSTQEKEPDALPRAIRLNENEQAQCVHFPKDLNCENTQDEQNHACQMSEPTLREMVRLLP